MNTKEAIEAVIREDMSGWGGELIGIDNAAEYIAGVIDEKCARIEQLEALLEQRDAFIVKNGLWHKFVDTIEETKDM